MTDLTPELREALEAVPDEWTERRTWLPLIEAGYVEDWCPSGCYMIRRTPAGRAAFMTPLPLLLQRVREASGQ